MRRLLLAAILLAPPLFAQDPMAISANNAASRIDGGVVLPIVTYNDTFTNGTVLTSPCGSDGTAQVRQPCLSDPITLLQPTTPGTAQTGNVNITGKGIFGTNVEVPSGGSFGGTALARLIATSTDGQWEICKNASCDNTGSITFGQNGGSSGGKLAATTSEFTFNTGSGAAFRSKFSQFALGQRADTGANVTLSYTIGAWTSTFGRCDATSNTVAYALATSASTGAQNNFYKADTTANPCTITRASSDTINGITALSLVNRGDYVVIADGSNGNVADQVLSPNYWVGPNGTTNYCHINGLTPNGGAIRECTATELLTLSTGGLTTLTAANILCPICDGSATKGIIDSVESRITTTITTTTNYALGDATITSRFCSASATLTSGSVQVCQNQVDLTGTSGKVQASAAKLQVTCTGSNPGAGILRLVVHYRAYTAPTS